MVAFGSAVGDDAVASLGVASVSSLANPVIRMVAFASGTEGAGGITLAEVAGSPLTDPVITMAAFESGAPAPDGSPDVPTAWPFLAAFTCRDTVSRSTPSSDAIRRYDQFSRARPRID